jgi:hypothetical protein
MAGSPDGPVPSWGCPGQYIEVEQFLFVSIVKLTTDERLHLDRLSKARATRFIEVGNPAMRHRVPENAAPLGGRHSSYPSCSVPAFSGAG